MTKASISLSTCLEFAGFAAITVATYVLAGLAAGLYVTGGVLLLLGYATDEGKSVPVPLRPFQQMSWRLRATRERPRRPDRRRPTETRRT